MSRVFLPGRTVIRKEPLGPEARLRLRAELAVLERLRGVAGAAQLAEAPDGPQYRGSLFLADAGTTSAAGLAEPLTGDDLIGFAVLLARAVAGTHARGVIHRDIAPANIVISRDGAPCLVGFGSATGLAELRPEFTHHTQVVGTLAYLAPEQTGRTGRSVDERTDLYALGATLYELATGEPPFGRGDALRLTHDHLARVPVPPARVTPTVPGLLSEIVMRLLEKEPDRRYQSAEGVLYDLERVRDADARAAVRIGERDVPLRLVAPSRLVGRDEEVAALEAAFEEALAGRCRGVLVGGAPGVGKTALVDQLRPVVTARDGWFVAGKFDQYRRDLEFDAAFQAFRALGRLLLAEPEDELARVRERILRALGSNAGLATAVVPEFAALLAVPPEPGNPQTAQVRAQRNSVESLRAVASRERPLVVFLDDLQWAGRTPLGMLDLVLSEEAIEGLLLVGAYRDVDAAHPLSASLSRWREEAGVRHLRLENLPVSGSVAIVAEMLRMDPAAALALVEVIGPSVSGNPYETVELLVALLRDRVLAATAGGWRWDEAAVRARLRPSELAALPAARLEAMPAPSRAMVEAMACLGGRVDLSLLQMATGEPAEAVEQALAPALDHGLLVAEPGTQPAARFRHDRNREAILHGLEPQRRRVLQLAMARRLAGVPELFAVAAEQYLPVIGAVEEAAERRPVVALLRRAADQARLIGDYARVDALLAAALRLVDPDQTTTLIELRTGRHTALAGLGRLEEADEEYRAIERLRPTAVQRTEPIATQIHSLTHRARFADAIGLGMDALHELGVVVPVPDRLPAELDRQFETMQRWLDQTDVADDLAGPEIADPTLLATARMLGALLAPIHFTGEPALAGWLSLEALRIWVEHGTAPTLVGPVSIASVAAVLQRADYTAAYRTARRVLEVSEARGYEHDTAEVRWINSYLSCWFKPIENGVQEVRRAREELIAHGNPVGAAHSYAVSAQFLLDCAPTLDVFLAEVHEGLAFARRTGAEQTGQWLEGFRWLAGVLRGERSTAAGDPVATGGYDDNPAALLLAHLNRAIAAAIFGDQVDLTHHTEAAIPLLPAVTANYQTAVAHALRGLALAGQARAGHADQRGKLLSELDEVTQWLGARAADAPDNYLYLLRLVEAERAWAVGEFRAAALAFDTARREIAGRRRPWHRALIAERAARFDLSHGLDQAGHELLAEARRHYLAWGATAKVAQLDWAYPTLRPQADATAAGGQQPGEIRSAVTTTGTIDLVGILSASQMLSSETSIRRLHARVAEVVGAMTGATDVHLLLWSDEQQDWLLPAPDSDAGTVPVSGNGAIPRSVLRYTQRTGEPLAVADASRDDRFARDPYFAGVSCCSLLAVPILSRDVLRAVLLLENRLIRDGFSTDRLDAVKPIAGQLAVSLDNAQLYTELAASRARIVTAADEARRRIERDLHDGAQQRLVHTIILLKLAREALGDAGGQEAELVGEALDQAQTGLTQLRELARGIHPRILSSGGLGPALRALADLSPIPVTLDVRTGARLPERVEVTAYYTVSEALTNAARYSNASAVQLTVETIDGAFRLSISDDGAGGADPTGGSGLVGLRDRVEALSGTLTLQSRPGHGTRLAVEIPLNADMPAGPS